MYNNITKNEILEIKLIDELQNLYTNNTKQVLKEIKDPFLQKQGRHDSEGNTVKMILLSKLIYRFNLVCAMSVGFSFSRNALY